jgi:ketosteroid isomerase-like protein
MEASQIEAKAKEFIDALHILEEGNEQDANGLAELYAEDATLTNAALDLKGGEIKGRDAILSFWVEYKSQLGEVTSHFHHVTASAEAAGLFWTTEGTSPSGDKVHYHGSTLLQFDEQGLITFFRGYYDTRELQVKAPVK